MTLFPSGVEEDAWISTACGWAIVDASPEATASLLGVATGDQAVRPDWTNKAYAEGIPDLRGIFRDFWDYSEKRLYDGESASDDQWDLNRL